MIFCLSLFTLSLNASGSVSAPCSENLPSATEYEELEVGELVVRPDPCTGCNQDCYGWIVIEKIAPYVCIVQCGVCGHTEVL